MRHPQWADLPELNREPRHALALKITKGASELQFASFRRKAGARLMHSIARNCDVLSVEEIVAFLSHTPRAI
jgi:hypothetical protein